MNQKQSDKIKRLYRELSEEQHWERAEKAAKHLLTAVAFKETSRVSFEKTNSVLLPPIGYYYSIFHMSVALCWLHPEIEDTKLKKLKHATLQGLIDTYFINPKLLSDYYSSLMQGLKEEREFLNYTFGEFSCDFFEEVEKNEKYVDDAFKISIDLIDEICELLRPQFDIRARISTYIADSKGEDFIQTYLSTEEQDRVMDFLVKVNYSN
ncbi:hypothetical protein ABZX01_004570 [Vibrio vulnificus]